MPNIHQVQNEGSSTSLGPVKVEKAYPMKGGDKSAFILISDSSGKSAIKIWGLEANQMPRDGDVVTVRTSSDPKSRIENKEWPAGSGKFTINANGCWLENASSVGDNPTDNGNSEKTFEPAPSRGGNTGGDKLPETMDRAAEATKLFVDALCKRGFTREEAIMLAPNASNTYPLWWFGEKGLQ